MKCLTAAALLLCCVGAGAAVNDRGEAARVVVYLNSGGAWLPCSLVSQGEDEASRLFVSEGIRLEWHTGKPPRDASEVPDAASVIAITFHVSSAPQYVDLDRRGALAVAYPYSKGTLPIVVFGDRVSRFLAQFRSIDSGKLLGHVLAHEIAHVLQGVARHSNSGLMKARWNWRDLDEIREGGLGFAEQDQQLLRDRFVHNSGTEAP